MILNVRWSIYLVMIFLSAPMSVAGIGCSEYDDAKKEGQATVQSRDINAVKEDHTKELMSLPGVVGAYVGQLDDGTPCIGVMVVNKTPELEKKIPKMLEGYPVKVDETGEIRPLR